MEQNDLKSTYKFGSFLGFLIVLGIGFAFYFLLPLIPTFSVGFYNYNNIIDGINNDFIKQILWFFINWTEPTFYGGAMSSLFLIIGAAIAWRLASSGKYSGTSICYGQSNIWPWLFSTQVLSLAITMWGFQYMNLFDEGLTWVPTFIVVVSAPGAIILTYGPSIPHLLTAAILPAIFSTPIAYWAGETFMPLLRIPGGLANIFTMLIVGFVTMAICNKLPWMKKRSVKAAPEYSKLPWIEEKSRTPMCPKGNTKIDYYSPMWFVRRSLADFTEPQFYGNEIASIFLIVGVVIDWIINNQHGTGGSAAEMLPAVLLTQFIAAAVGILLYASKYEEHGFFATFVPIVSISPFCVLTLGATLPIAIFAGVVGAVVGAPLAYSLSENLPEGMHGLIPNVAAMFIGTTLVWAAMSVMPWF